jgi:hypothetical protein
MKSVKMPISQWEGVFKIEEKEMDIRIAKTPPPPYVRVRPDFPNPSPVPPPPSVRPSFVNGP